LQTGLARPNGPLIRMHVLLYIVGALLVGFGAIDALWTTLWVDGNAGPFTRRHNSWMRRLILRLAGRHHRLLSLTGPIVLVSSVLVWAVIPWFGWVLLFSGDPRSLLHTQSGTPSDVVDRIYFTGYTMFTLGNGDFSPNGKFWELATSWASLNGLFMLTLAVTYLLAIIEAVVAKRSFASQVWTLGKRAEEFVLNTWDGHGFPAVELQIVSLTEQLQLVTEQHHAYPMLHFYHEALKKQSVSHNLAVFSEVLLIFGHGVAREVRPAPAALVCAQRAVEEFLDTLRSAYVTPSQKPTPAPDLSGLTTAGVPLVSEQEFMKAVAERQDRRKLLRGFLESERRDWP
jgi:Ion channel